MPRIRVEPEDFQVEEEPLYRPCGSGPFLHLKIEKRLLNTDEVAQRLAEVLDLSPREIHWAGRKDRVAVARQWLSLPADAVAGDPEKLDLGPGIKVLDSARHVERLGVGQLASNFFRLRVRSVVSGWAERAKKRFAELQKKGMPNRYGRQRFGRDGRNPERGRRVLAGHPLRGGRRTAWLMVTALQSQVFNEVLDRRADALDEVWTGDVALVHDTGELAWVDDAASWEQRVRDFEASATGPLFGTKMHRPKGPAAVLEAAVLRDFDLPDLASLKLPRGMRLFGDRRALRVRPSGAEIEYDLTDSVLHLSFRLPVGSYATVLLDELFPEGYDEGNGLSPRLLG
ncbi:MAG: tRNA pseudouridine(13) synthase TruD [Thermoanaerobaculia bacterium]|nr:tRNA pseudouridine(13) synthase TruD [Thermoanaerobaculia bacterium]